MAKNNFTIVGIGASAGGLDAIQQLFDNLPYDTGMAFVIIQHLSPDFKSLMPELLAKHTQMKIFTAEDKQKVEPNCIYLNQRNKNLHIKNNLLYLLDKGPKHNLNLPIDIFFHTLGEEYKENSVGIILSGTGSDGSRGIKTIKEAGGTIIVQTPSSAQFDGMPNSAIATNLVDFILDTKEISNILVKINSSSPITLSSDKNTDLEIESVFKRILIEIHKTTGIDFKLYKRNTLLRRLEKRMHVHNLYSLEDYLKLLLVDKEEVQKLQFDFLIGVTSFFRDIEAFDFLRKNIIPKICEVKNNINQIRIWVAGCSTGEEVYSIAMLLDDYIKTDKLDLDFKIFATDIDSRAIEIASNGSYSSNIISEVEKKFLDNYFEKSGDKVQIIKRLREKIVFSKHNILKDPPFIRMDLITCRNMLIYLENKAQIKVLLNFQFGLNKFGYLFLGHSESLGESQKYFKTINNSWKIFQNILDTKRIPSQTNPENIIPTTSFSNTIQSLEINKNRFKENPETIFLKYLSEKFSPAAIFIDKSFNILFIKGNAGKRLFHAEGIFNNNLLKMVHPNISSIIESGISKVIKEKQDVIIKDIVTKSNGTISELDLIFHKPVMDDRFNNIFLIQFSEERKLDEKTIVIKNVPVDEISKQRLSYLEDELATAKVELQNAIEELETSNEELQSSNEELMASNEELQSTNEELQSVNEELFTVNAELQEKNKELNLLNNDVTNLFNSTEIGTLFLDNNLHIRKFTPSLQKHFYLVEDDLGRSISSFASNFDEETRNSIIKDCDTVLKEKVTIEKRLKNADGRHYLKRISPFITLDKEYDGIVITFVDIQSLYEAEKQIVESNQRFELASEATNVGFWELDLTDNKFTGNNKWREIFGFKKRKTTIESWLKKISTNEVIEIKKNLKNHLEGKSKIFSAEYLHTMSSGKKKVWIRTTGKVTMHDNQKKPLKMSGVSIDITDLKENNLLLETQWKQFEAMLNGFPEIMYVADPETYEIIFVNEHYKKLLGKNPIGKKCFKEFKGFDEPCSFCTNDIILNNNGKSYTWENKDVLFNSDFYIADKIIKWPDGRDVRFEIAIDISKQKKSEAELEKSLERLNLSNKELEQFAYVASHDLQEPLRMVSSFTQLLEKKYYDLLDETGRQYIYYASDGANRMQKLINDLLDYSRITSKASEFLLFPLSDSLNEAIDNLQIKIEETMAIINCDPLPDIIGDQNLLSRLFQNLIDNSLKYRSKLNPLINIYFKLIESDVIRITVEDNGLGFDMKYKDKIFVIFQRLHNRDEYSGTGIGLSNCKKIVERHGGKIWVESKPGLGTKVHFTLRIKGE